MADEMTADTFWDGYWWNSSLLKPDTIRFKASTCDFASAYAAHRCAALESRLAAAEKGRDEAKKYFLNRITQLNEHSEQYEEIARENAKLREALSARDKAVEHAGYLADAAQHYLDARNAFDMAKAKYTDEVPDLDGLSDCHQGLRCAIYEFRKRRSALAHPVEAAPEEP